MPRKSVKCPVCGKKVDVFGADSNYIKHVQNGSGTFYHEKCFEKRERD